jgi:predicted RNase H-like HicB family nuclease
MNDTAAAARPITMQVTVTLTALVHPEPEVGGYSAEVPALPGCYTEGETLDEVRANLREAAEGWLNSAHDRAIAQPRTEGSE